MLDILEIIQEVNWNALHCNSEPLYMEGYQGVHFYYECCSVIHATKAFGGLGLFKQLNIIGGYIQYMHTHSTYLFQLLQS